MTASSDDTLLESLLALCRYHGIGTSRAEGNWILVLIPPERYLPNGWLAILLLYAASSLSANQSRTGDPKTISPSPTTMPRGGQPVSAKHGAHRQAQSLGV